MTVTTTPPGTRARPAAAYEEPMTASATPATKEPEECSHEDLVRYLEDRFACAQACDDCARVCLVREGPAGPGEAPRLNTACADVCEATSRVLAEQSDQDEQRVRMQVEWCRAICLQCASLCDLHPAAADCAEACRRCAKACDAFLTTLG